MEIIDPHVYEVADEGLLELIEKARVSALTPEEYARYEAELKIIGDEGSAECYGYDRGIKEGRAQGRAEGEAIGLEKGKFQEQCVIATRLVQKGFDDATILDLCPLLTPKELDDIRSSQTPQH
ncbi:MAG: hypothetical protein MJZ33_12225 [Paludibacteraceae bacterium]|nr:hypothetical protein [Paludibacteraceae bacterium]